jgi:hypothetical protein
MEDSRLVDLGPSQWGIDNQDGRTRRAKEGADPKDKKPWPSCPILSSQPTCGFSSKQDYPLMSHVPLPLAPRRFGETMRTDAWWASPAAILLLFSGFILYSTWAALQGNHYTFGPYLSPFYSPEIFGDSPHALLGPKPGWWPSWLLFSPAILILWAPGGFRFTCYYYRGAYYKAFWADPPACAVGEPRSTYLGERHFPLILQNVHRYFMYLAIIFLAILLHDVWDAMWFTDAPGHRTFGIGVGTLVLATNLVLLSGYTLGCHSLRHMVGGILDRLTERPARSVMYQCAGAFNRNHMQWARLSLVMVAFSDLYIRLCSMGIWHDWRIV